MNNPIVKNGVLIGICGIVIGLLNYLFLGNGLVSGLMSLLSMAVYIIFMTRSGKEVRASDGGFISFGKAFKTVFLTGLIGAAIGLVWTFIQMTFITPDMMADVMAIQEEKMLEQGMSEEAIEGAQKWTNMFSSTSGMMMMGGAMIILGLIPSLIVAAVIKRDRGINDPATEVLDEGISA